jgi:hypothetical protein
VLPPEKACKALIDLVQIVNTLEGYGMSPVKTEDIKRRLLSRKQYLKTDYKVRDMVI